MLGPDSRLLTALLIESLHAEFVDRLLPVLDELLKASAAAGQTRADIRAYDLMLAIGNLCIGVETFPDYHARRMIDLLLAGLAPVNPTTDGHNPK